MDAYLTQALVLTAAGLHRDAKAAIDEVFRRDPKPSSSAYLVLGIIEFALRDNSSAIASLETYAKQSERGGRDMYPAFLFAAYGEAGRMDKVQTFSPGQGFSVIN